MADSPPTAESQAGLGYGAIVEVQRPDSPSTWDELKEVYDITPPSMTVDQVDVTHMRSPGRRREFIDGLIDPGEMSFEMNYVPGSASDLILLAILNTAIGQDRSRTLRVTYPNGKTDTFSANLQGYEPAVPTDDKMTATVTWKVSGTVTRGVAV